MSWEPSDLDRCGHGQHVEQPCARCPNGISEGNQYLDPLANPRMMETRGLVERRIGTDREGRPIWVTPGRGTLPLE